MPSVSPQQHRLMEAVAHDPEVAKKTGIPQHVGKEFVNADSAEQKEHIFHRHFGKSLHEVPVLLQPKNKVVDDHLALHQSLAHKVK